ncbi:acetyl-CoA carboxylase biotin carboxyl carrier protein [Nonomuraea sp. SYSU D8015]|uniref:acetyl-CoA carboxylase biotin carboxyl carrier protein n=1 Tax=Nonomuraea sp. SYSU D8015 TaxID=2593644 RepID=UPI0016606EC9|nr:acetyl-CoA carboxylase biotin carboxyl carrier protein subunit [Nonomuraea sp. SYSU D8015]
MSTSITSPMAGTFYRGPNLSADPFVRPGDVVKTGQTLCIVEAMKLENEIQSDRPGRILKVCAENGAPVEYGQELFVLGPL